MAENQKNIEQDFDEEENLIVEMTDDEGNVYLYAEEMIIPIDDKKFALLVAVPSDDEEEHHHHHDCDCGCDCDCDCGDEDVIIAKIITNEDGEEEYVEPTDEEFEIVRQAYNDFFGEEIEDDRTND